jgi:transposase-like protein
VDWKKLRAEYIKGGTSYRKLAEKYDVSFHTLRKQAAKENWKALRDEVATKTVTKIVEIESDQQAERMRRLLTVSDKLLLVVEDAVEKFRAEELLLDRTALKSLSGTIKDIKDIQSLKRNTLPHQLFSSLLQSTERVQLLSVLVLEPKLLACQLDCIRSLEPFDLLLDLLVRQPFLCHFLPPIPII